MTAPARYGNRRVPKMLAEINALRRWIAAEGKPAIQDAWDRVEEHIDFAYGRIVERDNRQGLAVCLTGHTPGRATAPAGARNDKRQEESRLPFRLSATNKWRCQPRPAGKGLVRATSPKIQAISVADPDCRDPFAGRVFQTDLASDQTNDPPEAPHRRASEFSDHCCCWFCRWGSRGTLHISTAGYALDDTYIGTDHSLT